ncbi:MAG: hypothetical protein WDW36_004769 [Sanguina aurantia]
MPVITVQLGQCGNQLGSCMFQALATEMSGNDYGLSGVEEYFRHIEPSAGGSRRGTGRSYIARALLMDMEPKVVQQACTGVAASNTWWSYGSSHSLCQQSGSGNNWAQGFHGFGPRMHDAAMELVRREVEATDVMGGFLLLQSMAGGTGAGFGTYVAQALRDEYHSSLMVNSCVWPYESGEVIVQPYNTLLTLSHLADLSDGILLTENEALHRVCTKMHNVKRPSFQDMNGVAARALASVLLPSTHRPATLPTSGGPQARSPLGRSVSGGGSASRGDGHRGSEG